MRISAKLALRTRTSTPRFEVETRFVMQNNHGEDIYKTQISSCFMHFDGVTEQVCKLHGKGLRSFLSVGLNVL